MNQKILRLEGITKRFGSVLANAKIDLSVERGTVRGLVGENGAGKTTLMRIVYGMYRPDLGRIFFRQNEVLFSSPRDAMAIGIAMVHQHSLLVPSMNVVENVLLSKPQGRYLDFTAAERDLESAMVRYDIRLDLKRPTRDLSVAERQRAEILSALYGEADLIILDEPTTVLTPQEATTLFESLRKLTREGKTIIFISHKLPEVMQVTDDVTILRGGQVVASRVTARTSEEELASLMVGREVILQRTREKTVANSNQDDGVDIVSVQGLYAEDDQGNLRVEEVSLIVKPGEILGIAAVQGNGQNELVESIAGIGKVRSGHIFFEGSDVTKASVRRRRELGMRYVPRDRLHRGINGQASVWENLVLGYHYRLPIARRGLLDRRSIRELSIQRVTNYQIKTPSIETMAMNLSGGNLQKVIIARELTTNAAFVIAEEPTQGVDVAATEFIRDAIMNLRNQGVAILLVSSALDEILALSDRIMVMYSGRVVGLVQAQEANEQVLGRMMMGVRQTESNPTDQ